MSRRSTVGTPQGEGSDLSSEESPNDGEDAPEDDTFFGDIHDPQKKIDQREIRKQYRELLTETQEDEKERNDLDNLTSKLISAEAIFEQSTYIQMPREAALDAKVVSTLASLGVTAAQSLDTNLIIFAPREYAERMANFMSPANSGTLNWNNFGEQTSTFFDRAPSFNFMYGSFETDEQEKEARAPIKRSTAGLQVNEAQKQAPEKVDYMGKNYQAATKEEVENVLCILRQLCDQMGGPVCFFEFAVNPDSFMETVMNIFHISFLIKDDYAQVFLDDDGLLAIEAIPSETDSRKPSRKPEPHQVVLSMNKAEWKEIVKEFEIEKPAIIPIEKTKNAS